MEYYLAIKRNEVLIHEGTRKMKPENMILSEKEPVRKDHILYDFISMNCPE